MEYDRYLTCWYLFYIPLLLPTMLVFDPLFDRYVDAFYTVHLRLHILLLRYDSAICGPGCLVDDLLLLIGDLLPGALLFYVVVVDSEFTLRRYALRLFVTVFIRKIDYTRRAHLRTFSIYYTHDLHLFTFLPVTFDSRSTGTYVPFTRSLPHYYTTRYDSRSRYVYDFRDCLPRLFTHHTPACPRLHVTTI